MTSRLFKSDLAQKNYLAHYIRRAASWPVPTEEKLVPTSYGLTFVRVSGAPDGLPLMMLPGIGSHGLTFGPLVAELGPTIRTYIVDNIHDVGRSVETKPVTSAQDFAAWLDEVRLGLGLQQMHLLGLSYGGWVAAQYALRFPQAVSRLIFLAPAGTVAPLPWGFIWRAILCLLPFRFFMRNFLRWVAPELPSTPSGLRRFEEMVDDALLATRTFVPRKMVPPIPLADDIWGMLPGKPFFLAGEHEVIFHARTALEKLQRLAPNITTQLLAGAGHDFFVTRAPEVAERIRSALS